MAVRLVVVAYEEFPDDEERYTCSTMDVCHVGGRDLMEAILMLKRRIDEFAPEDVSVQAVGRGSFNSSLTATTPPTVSGVAYPISKEIAEAFAESHKKPLERKYERKAK